MWNVYLFLFSFNYYSTQYYFIFIVYFQSSRGRKRADRYDYTDLEKPYVCESTIDFFLFLFTVLINQ